MDHISPIKIFLSSLIGLFLLGCSHYDAPEIVQDNNSLGISSLIRDEEEISQIALDATQMLSSLENGNKSRSKDDYIIESIFSLPQSYSRSVDYPLLSVVNFEGDNGFAIVSNYKSMPELIAISDNGHYYPQEGTTNPGLSMYIESIQNPANWDLEVKSSIDIPIEPPKPAIFERTLRDTVSKSEVAPRLKMNWGQGNVAGQFCPNKVAGCSNVALAMAIAYFKHPSYIAPTYIHPNHGPISLNWEKILAHKNDLSFSFNDSCDNESYPTHETYGKLLRELGHRSGTSYGYNDDGSASSATPISGTYQTACDLGFAATRKLSYEAGDVKKYLTYGIILLGGNRLVEENKYSGHMWACDGYKYYNIKERYQQKEGENGTWKTIHTDYHSYLYNHFNWGWNGFGNGYFLDMEFGPSVKNYKFDVQFIVIKR